MTATVSPLAYWSTTALLAVGCTALCLGARRHPGAWVVGVARVIGLLLAADAVSYTIALLIARDWSPKTSLPLALCNVAVVVGSIACWWRVALLVELTYFWGLAGTLQAVITPDLSVGFPHLVFFQYLIGHLGIVTAGLFLVVGLRIVPRPYSVGRVFGITLAYAAFVGLIDTLTGANYMFLRRPPGEWTVLRLLGPWPWYLLSAVGVALVMFTLLDAPFWAGRRRDAEHRRVRVGADLARESSVPPAAPMGSTTAAHRP